MSLQSLVAKKNELVLWMKTPMDEGYDPATKRARRLGRWGFNSLFMGMALVAELFEPMPNSIHTLLLSGGLVVLMICGFMFGMTWFEPGRAASRPSLAEAEHKPPRFPRFLLLLIPKRNREHLLGDLEEEYLTIILPDHGGLLANLWYWWHALISLVSQLVGLVLFWKRTH